MGQALGDILPAAVGVALSPMPVVAVILMLFSSRARTNGPAFVLGWVVGITVVLAAAIWLASAGIIGSGDKGDPSTASSVVHLLLGVGLLGLAIRGWRHRPQPGQEVTPPGWMASLSDASPLLALGMGVLLGGVNPKNLALNIAAGLAIAQAGLSLGESFLPGLIYVLIASISVAVPVLWYLLDQSAASRTLASWRTWLIANNATVMAVLLLILGVKQLGQGLGAFIG